MKWHLVLATLVLTACSSPKRTAAAPEYAGVTRQVEDITRTINLVETDSKEVKRLQTESLGLLDRLDYKTSVLLR